MFHLTWLNSRSSGLNSGPIASTQSQPSDRIKRVPRSLIRIQVGRIKWTAPILNYLRSLRVALSLNVVPFAAPPLSLSFSLSRLSGSPRFQITLSSCCFASASSDLRSLFLILNSPSSAGSHFGLRLLRSHRFAHRRARESMANLCLGALLALLLLLSPLALSADPPQIPPAPALQQLPPDAPSPASPPPDAGAPESPPSSISPPSPPPPGSPPAPSPVPDAPAPSPSGNSTGTSRTGVPVAGGSSGGGLSSTKKAGIVAAAVVLAGLVVLAGMVYKRRKDNIRRSQYGYAARREIL